MGQMSALVTAGNLLATASLLLVCCFSNATAYEKDGHGIQGDKADMDAIQGVKADVTDLQQSVVQVQSSVAQLNSTVQQLRIDFKSELDARLGATGRKHECRRNNPKKLEAGRSGVFTVRTPLGSYTAFCDRSTNDGGGWIVVQRREDGSVVFDRNWADYRRGFGSVHGEYWLGLDTLHRLTSQRGHPFELRFDMTFAHNGSQHVAKYSHFKVGPESGGYRLEVSGFSSPDLEDSMAYQNNMKFSTKDRDNDVAEGDYHCSRVYKGGWWFKACHTVNINGEYGRPNTDAVGVTWLHLPHHTALSFVEMKIRPHRQ